MFTGKWYVPVGRNLGATIGSTFIAQRVWPAIGAVATIKGHNTPRHRRAKISDTITPEINRSEIGFGPGKSTGTRTDAWNSFLPNLSKKSPHRDS
jgi:hypothetical protein